MMLKAKVESRKSKVEKSGRAGVELSSFEWRIANLPRRGVTLIDVIAAIVILSVALPPMITSFAEASMQSIKPSYATAAGFLAMERMEEIVARRSQSGGYAQVVSANFATESPVTGYTRYTRSVTITEVASDLTTPQSGSGLKKVVVSVTWDSGARNVQLSRLFADY